MARPVYGRDRRLQARMGLTIVLLGLLYVVGFTALSIVFPRSIAFWVVIALVMLVVQVWFSDRLALAAAGARVVSPEQAPQLHAAVDRLCLTADIPKPRVAVIPTDMPNAFATGRSQRHAVVAVTEGILRRLEPQELEGVLAHELTHIRNRDVVVMTVASFFAIVAGLITRMFFWTGMGLGGGNRDRNDNSGAVVAVAVLVSIVVYVLSFVLIRALSRYREFAADRGAAVITKAPSQLASALLKISGAMGRIPQRDLRAAESLSQFYIVAPSVKQTVAGLFATHPPVEQRLAQLRRLQAELEGI
jgi:heat shock protein HtpX